MARKKTLSTTRISPRNFSSKVKLPAGYVDYCRNDLNVLLPAYYLIRDAIEGELAIKGIISSSGAFPAAVVNPTSTTLFSTSVLTNAKKYLPMPNAADTSQENQERYKAYVQRAVYYNATARTLEGLVGQIFLRAPVVVLPSELELMKEDADGGQLTLDQIAGRAVRFAISYGRCGLLADYPVTNGQVSIADVESGTIRPTLIVYAPWDIINWRVELVGAKRVLTLLVLRESVEETADNGFTMDQYKRYRVFRRDPATGYITAQIYNEADGGFESDSVLTPTDGNGQPFKEIPFTFVGSENNDAIPNKPPLYDLASLNIAHYRNSADYEESCFFAGQPTPVLSGLDQSWVDTVLKGRVTLGSRAAIPLPVNATAELLQAQPNSMPVEAMREKEQQMVALGAKLVQIENANKTATQAHMDVAAEASPLGHVAKNVSMGMVYVLGIAAQYVRTDPKGIQYQLNSDFDITGMTADDQAAVVQQWQSAAISFHEMRTVLRRAGTAIETDDDKAMKDIQKGIDEGMIPDPVMSQQPQAKAPTAKAASDTGGPQPKRPKRQSKPGGSATQ